MTRHRILRNLLFPDRTTRNPMAGSGFCKTRAWPAVQVTALLLLLTLGAVAVFAQAGSSGTIVGTVTDPGGAVVTNATVTITDKDTNDTNKVTTNSAGQFTVPSMKPGRYEIRISKQGFQTAVMKDQTVEIGKQLTANVTLKVGVVTEEVTVTAEAVQLQTLDASVGNVLDEQALEKLPSLSRDATALLLLQPLAAPGFNGGAGYGESNSTGGGIAGARADQNTFLLDGGDATSNTEGGGGYAQQSGGGFSATPHASIPTPVESLEEFRVTTNNSSTFARSSGGEVQMMTRRGTNSWHGAVYENNQNTAFNANSWQLNRIGKPRGVWQDNRFGGRLGGPVIKDKAFFFMMYE